MFSYIPGQYLARLSKWFFLLTIQALLFATCIQGAVMSVPSALAPHALLLDVAKAGHNLIAVGYRGHVLVSTDGGKNWQQQIVPTQVLLTSVYFTSEQHGWATGHDQTILETIDGGLNWQLRHEGSIEDTPLFDIWFADELHGFAIGAYALYLTTEDGGKHWQPVTFAPRETDEETAGSVDEKNDDYGEPYPFDFHLHRLAQSDSGTLYLAAEAGNILRSRNQGKTWLNLPSPYEGSFFGVLVLENDELLIFGLRGHLYRSADAGETWTKIQTATTALLSSGTKLADGTILLAGEGGLLLVSRDKGRSFKQWRQQDSTVLVALLETAPKQLVAVGSGGARLIDCNSFEK